MKLSINAKGTFHFLFFILLLAGIPIALHSETLTIVGRILDKETRKPIAGVRVQIANSNRGTYSSASGFFKLPDVPIGSKLFFKSIGYKDATIELNSPKDTIVVYLVPSPIKLQEVEKVGEIEADEVIRRAIKRKRDNLAQLKTLQAKVYSKLTLEFGGGIFETKVDTVESGIKFTTTFRARKPEDSIMVEFVRNFILETFSNTYIDYEKKIQYSEITQRRQTANIPKEFNQIVLTQFLNFYDETVKIVNTEFVTPLSDDAFKYYRFELLGKELYGDLYVYSIKIIPNTKIYPAFIGSMKILEKNYNLLEIDVAPSENTAIEFLDSVRYEQKFATLSEKFWYPTYLDISGKIKLGVVKGFLDFNLRLRGVSIISDAIVNQPLPDSILAKGKVEKIVVDAKADSIGVDFWENNALIETSEKEKEIYRKVDTIAKKIDTTVINPFNTSKKFKWGLLSESSNVAGYNRVTGYTLSLSPYVEYSGIRFGVSPIYSFEQKKFYFDANLSYNRYNPFGTVFSTFSFSIFSKPEITSLQRKMPLFLNSLFSYFFHWDYYDYYQKNGLKIDYSVKNNQVKPFTALTLSFEHAKHFSLSKKTNKSLFSNETWRENPPILEGTYDVVTLGIDVGSKTEVLGFQISDANLSYRFGFDLLFGKRTNGSAFGGISAQIDIQIPTFYTGYQPMNLRLLLEAGAESKGTPPQYSFRMPNAWGFGNFLTANTGLYGGTRFYTLHLEHNFSDLFWRAIGLPKHKGRGLEFSLLASLGYFSNFGEMQIYKPTKKLFYEFGLGLARVPSFVSDFIYWGVHFKFNPDRQVSKGFGFGLDLSLPF